MAVKTVFIFYIFPVLHRVSNTNELTVAPPSIHTLVAKIKHALPAQKRLLLDVQLKMSQKKIRRQVMVEFCNTFHGVKFD